MSQMRPAAGGESRERDSLLLFKYIGVINREQYILVMVAKVASKNREPPWIYSIFFHTDPKFDKRRVWKVQIVKADVGYFMAIHAGILMVDTKVF